MKESTAFFVILSVVFFVILSVVFFVILSEAKNLNERFLITFGMTGGDIRNDKKHERKYGLFCHSERGLFCHSERSEES